MRTWLLEMYRDERDRLMPRYDGDYPAEESTIEVIELEPMLDLLERLVTGGMRGAMESWVEAEELLNAYRRLSPSEETEG